MTRSARIAILVNHVGAPSEVFIRRHVEYFGEDGRLIVKRRASPSERAWGDDLSVDVLPRGTRLGKRLAQLRSLVVNGDRRTLAGATRNQRKALAANLRHAPPDAVLVEYLSPWLAYLRELTRMPTRIFGHAHGYDVSRLLRDRRWARAYLEWNRSEGVIVPSCHIRERLVKLGIDPGKLYVVPYGVEVPAQLPAVARKPSEPFRFVAVGRMVAKKAPLLTLQTFHSVWESRRDVHLDMVGDGPLREMAEAYVRDHDLSECVTLWGAQPHRMVRRIMRGGQAFVQHSRVDPETGDEEGLPVGILEAMAHGLPVVATHHAGIPESVMDGETGYLVAEGDISGMREAMEALAVDPDLARTLGVQAWEWVAERFSVERQRASLRRLLLDE